MEESQDNGEVRFYHSSSTSLDGSELNNLLQAVEGHTPIIPESVVAHYMAKAGCSVTDPNVLKIISLSTQRFITSLVSEAQAHRVFNEASDMHNKMLTTSELQYAFKAKGIDVQKPQYFVDERDQ